MTFTYIDLFIHLYIYACKKCMYKINVCVCTCIIEPSKAPTGLEIKEITSSSAIITWNQLECTYHNGPNTGYVIVRASNIQDIPITTYISSHSQTSYNLTSLTPETNYSVKVAAMNREGIGPFSSKISFTTARGIMIDFKGMELFL